MVLQVAVLALSRSADARALGVKTKATRDEAYGWPIKLMCTLTVLTYVVAGVAKLRYTGAEWVVSDFLRGYVAYDALTKVELGSITSPIGIWLLGFAWLWKPLAALSLATELLAPIALINRRIGTYWVVAAWLFHLGVLAVMTILFAFPVFGFAYLCFFRVERLRLR